MSLKKSLVLPAVLLATLAAGSLAACTSTTSEIQTTSTSAKGTGLSFTWGADQQIEGLPTDIPYLKKYDNAKATGNEVKGDYELTINTGSKDAQGDAGKLLTDAGFTVTEGHIYTNSKWKVELAGNAGTVVYTIAKA